MDIQYQYDTDRELLTVRVVGTYIISDDISVVRDIVDQMNKYNCQRVLFDYRDAEFVVKTLSAYDRPKILTDLGVKRSVKFASLYTKLDRKTRYTETVYRNQGWRMRDFIDYEVAIEWLTEV